MFSYVDPSIRQKLEQQELLITLDRRGNPVTNDAEEAFLSILGPVPIPREIDGQQVTLEWYPFVRRTELSVVLDSAKEVKGGDSKAFLELLQSHMLVNSVFALPDFRGSSEPLIRVHSCCLTGDIFGSQRCDCGPQLQASWTQLLSEGAGAVVYISGHEGRGIGLWAKAITYLLQDNGQDTYEANRSLGLPEDSRDFSDAAIVLQYLLKGRAIRLLSNNPTKKQQLEAHGQPVSEVIPLLSGICEHNLRYLEAKRDKGHIIPEQLPKAD
ncbi:MAG: GTP cyclohydrolase [Gammaproteobacteria bacterium]|nr:MAG: GTP cyclohydrolase [Gammaproteobacteria bacterium]